MKGRRGQIAEMAKDKSDFKNIKHYVKYMI